MYTCLYACVCVCVTRCNSKSNLVYCSSYVNAARRLLADSWLNSMNIPVCVCTCVCVCVCSKQCVWLISAQQSAKESNETSRQNAAGKIYNQSQKGNINGSWELNGKVKLCIESLVELCVWSGMLHFNVATCFSKCKRERTRTLRIIKSE